MMVLVSGATATIRQIHPHAHLGALITPRAMQSLDWLQQSGITWAADNDFYHVRDLDQFCAMVDRIFRYAQNCRFVTIPDIVGDHESTLDQWEMYYPYVREVGLRCAFVIQDGATSDTIPWDQAQAVFLGGSTTYKLSQEARILCLEAKRRGLWVHVGRVNSARRERLIADFADSFDGTRYSMFARHHLPACLGRLDGTGIAPALPPRAPARRRAVQLTMDLSEPAGRSATEAMTRRTTDARPAAPPADVVGEHAAQSAPARPSRRAA